jgi:hypothetical protein
MYYFVHQRHNYYKGVREMSLALESVRTKLGLNVTDDPATRLVARKIIELAQRGVRDATTLSAMTLKEFKQNNGNGPRGNGDH